MGRRITQNGIKDLFARTVLIKEPEKKPTHEELESEVDKFLSSGGSISEIPIGVSGEQDKTFNNHGYLSKEEYEAKKLENRSKPVQK